LAPVQAVVLPITDNQLDYAKKIHDILKTRGIRAEIDDRNEKIGYKIREWETKKVPFMLVAGEKERAAGTLSLRVHRKGDTGPILVDAFVQKIEKLVSERTATIE
jgi:threonyl-tRNA synthetase